MAVHLPAIPACLIAVFATCACLTAPVSAQAQGADREEATIEQDQLELNEQGVRAIIDGDYTRAVALLTESLAYGEANVTYLNLGRAYQKKGDCKQARRALHKAKTAPVVEKPTPRIVDKQANKYLAELDEICPPPGTADQDAEPKRGEPGTETADAEAGPANEPDDAPEQQDVQMAEKDVQAQQDGGSNVLGWTSLATGVAMGGGAVALHLAAQEQRLWLYGLETTPGEEADVLHYDDQEAHRRERRANLYDSVGLGLGITGAALAGLGTYLLLTNNSGETTSVGMQLGPDRAMATAKWKF